MKEEWEYFRCQMCGAIIRVDQSPYDEPKIVYPLECYECQGGCGRKTKLLRLKKEYMEELKKKDRFPKIFEKS